MTAEQGAPCPIAPCALGTSGGNPHPLLAGDTFIGATLYALACGADADAALRCACAVAGAKVGRAGFDGLAADVTFRPAPRE
jgi:hypothetical protein